MSSFLILSDKDAHDILIKLSRDEITSFRSELEKALLAFSTQGEREHQPEPAVVRRPDGRKVLFRLFTSQTGPGVKLIVDPTTAKTKASKPGLHGFLALCDNDGLPVGMVNAEEITGYRTTMSVMIPYSWRRSTAKIVVFGAGKQALWHIRLALGLRGKDIKKITVINRSVERARSLVAQVQEENDAYWKSSVEFDVLDPAQADHETHLEGVVTEADAIFCTTPSTQPLLPARYLTGEHRKRRGCFVGAIGSWQPEMIELDPALLQHAVDLGSGHGAGSGLLIADDREGCMKNSGEIIRSGLTQDKILEIGEILNLRDAKAEEYSEKLSKDLEEGLVVYKSLGVSMTDLAAGNALLSLARKRGKGISVPDF